MGLPPATVMTKYSRKASAVSFLQMVVSGQIRRAYEKYISPTMRHHNVYYNGDAASLQKGMADNHTQFPNKHYEVKQALEDGDFVGILGHVQFKPNDPGIAVYHLFRFRGDKVVEMWDVGQAIPADSPNKNGAF